MSSSRLASYGCLFCVIATGQRWAGSYAWMWTRKLWRVFSCKNRYRYWTLLGQIEDCHFVWTYVLRPSSKNTFETLSLHCWPFICLFSLRSYIETWLSTFWKQVLVEVFRVLQNCMRNVCDWNIYYSFIFLHCLRLTVKSLGRTILYWWLSVMNELSSIKLWPKPKSVW